MHKMSIAIDFEPGMKMMMRSVRKYLSDVQTEAYREAQEILREMANRFRNSLVAAIEAQSFFWMPLSEAYLAQKIEAGLDQRTLIATGEYVDSIYVEEQQGQGVITISVTLPDRAHEATGINLRLLSRYLEYGTTRMPARPHWRPVMDRFLSDMDTRNDKLISEIVKRVRKKMGQA